MLTKRERAEAGYVRYLRDRRHYPISWIAMKLGIRASRVERLYEEADRWNVRPEKPPER